MPVNFPTSPTTNQTYTYDSKTWKWNGSSWDLIVIFTPISATGGTESTITVNGKNWKLHEFTSSGNFVVTDPGTNGYIEVLMVAGGGSGQTGSSFLTFGGGGGGQVYIMNYSVTSQTIPVTVGSGGASGGANLGGWSGFGTVKVLGGGAQAQRGANTVGAAATGSGVAAEDSPLGYYKGGSSFGSATLSLRGGGGGGGMSANGGNASSGTGGTGGEGFSTDFTGSTIVFGSGGGGGAGTTRGAGGTNAGSGASPTQAATSGTANRGGGGGGGCDNTNTSGGAGGSGLVAVRYPLEA